LGNIGDQPLETRVPLAFSPTLFQKNSTKHRIISPASAARFPDPAASDKDRLQSNYVSTPGAGRVSCDRDHTILNAITVIL
jgi:hypothetical protein